MKISINKCQFFQPQVKYVGHTVSQSDIAKDHENVDVAKRWKQPNDLKSLRSFLGFCRYYLRFIANYSAIVRHLTDLTKGDLPTQHNKKPGLGKSTCYFRESEPFGERWDQACSDTFNRIFHCLKCSRSSFCRPIQTLYTTC